LRLHRISLHPWDVSYSIARKHVPSLALCAAVYAYGRVAEIWTTEPFPLRAFRFCLVHVWLSGPFRANVLSCFIIRGFPSVTHGYSCSSPAGKVLRILRLQFSGYPNNTAADRYRLMNSRAATVNLHLLWRARDAPAAERGRARAPEAWPHGVRPDESV
jgi:hypothetical protein